MKRPWAKVCVIALLLLLLLAAVSAAPAEEEAGEAEAPEESPESVAVEVTEIPFFPDLDSLISPTPEPTPEPRGDREMSSVEYIFGGSSEDVNTYHHKLMASIAEFGDIYGYVNTKWPGAQGRRTPNWKDFSPVKPAYLPAFGMFIETVQDLVGQEWCHYGVNQQDLTLEDWHVTLVNGDTYWECEYERPNHISPWILKKDMGLEKITLSRMLTSNAGYSITIDLTGRRVLTTVAWRDADYNITWNWYEADGYNMLRMSWNETNLALHLLFRTDDGSMIYAVVADAGVSESSVYEAMVEKVAGQM